MIITFLWYHYLNFFCTYLFYLINHCCISLPKSFGDIYCSSECNSFVQEERNKVDDLRGSPMSVGTLEEIIDDNHAIVSTSVGSEHYVSILSFVDKDQLEPGCSVLLNHKVTVALMGIIYLGSFIYSILLNMC